MFVLQELIATVVSEVQVEKYKDLSLKQFVDSSSDIRWCPFPDCGYAICIKREQPKEKVDKDERGAVGGVTEKKLTHGENVECGQGHGFCWYVHFRRGM
jgi:ankyrin repeat/IBR domain-containing protein 1